jgi:hypothetical protein
MFERFIIHSELSKEVKEQILLEDGVPCRE